VSVFFGSLVYLYFWVSLNAVLMKLVKVDGHIIVIFAGIPLIAYLVHNLRENRIDQLIKLNVDKLQIDIDALIQINCMSDFANGVDKDASHRTTMIGLINAHVADCQNVECPCKEEYELYDIITSR
jgi:hypothetical protein